MIATIFMPLAAGTLLRSYELAELIGAHGEEDGYWVRDLRLNRDVAVKVTPAFFASESDRLRRFETLGRV